MLKDYVSTSIFVFNCYLCLGTLQAPHCRVIEDVVSFQFGCEVF